MRKSLFITVALSLCMAEFGAFSAPVRRPGGANSARAAQTTNVVKPGAGQQGASAPTVNVQQNNGGAVRGRPGATQNANTNGKAPTQNVGGNGKAPAANGARAAATKKAINMGTKVATATENTVVSQECQTAYYGCMDAFCMLDNASGGRCQCNDKITELDIILEQIMKLDEQSMRIATEGVETVEMGEYADQIKARTKSIEGEFATKEEKKVEAPAKKKSLDLSVFSNSSMFDDDDDDIFDTGKKEEDIKIADDLANKKGDELHKEAAKICTKQLPADCRNSASMLQMTYAQKIRSDCTGYENSLKQKKAESTQKLQTAQKAVREAVLEDVKNKNKYTTEGECVVAFDQCMQTTGGCGADYTGCVADDTILTMGTDGAKGTATTAQVKTSASAIGISANTLAMLTDRAPVCESVLKQCENVRKGVWASFLKMIVPKLKTAEVIAEQDRRVNCIGNIVDCYAKGCAAKWPNQESADYDMCLSNPDVLGNLCQQTINRCSTNGTGDQVLEYVKAQLASMRVDQCTKEVKDCLQSEDRCGKDYAKCVGFDTESIADLCPTEKLTACAKDAAYKDPAAIRKYVNQIASGLSLQIDNNMLVTCENAVKTAMEKSCGGEESCIESAIISDLGSNTLDYKVCQMIISQDDNGVPNITLNTGACKESAEQISEAEMGLNELVASNVTKVGSTYSGSQTSVWFGLFSFGGTSASQSKTNYINATKYTVKPGEITTYTPYISGKIDWGTSVTTEQGTDNQVVFKNKLNADHPDYNNVKMVVDSMNEAMVRIISGIENDPTVKYCMTGREVQGMDGMKFGKHSADKDANGKKLKKEKDGVGNRFPNLTNQIRNKLANQLYTTATDNYNEKLSELNAKRDEDFINIAGKYAAVADKNNEMALNQRNGMSCNALNSDKSDWNYKETVTATYSESTKICTKVSKITKCKRTSNAGNPGKRTCTEWEAPTEKTEQLQM